MATQIVEIPTPVQTPAPAVFLTQLAFGMKMTQALYVAAKLGIADLLSEGPRQVSELAAATETSERSLYRVLRSLAAVGIFRETDPKVFELTPYADALRSDVPNSFRYGAIFMGEEWLWNVMGQMLYSVKTGKPAWSRVHGADAFDYLADNHRRVGVCTKVTIRPLCATSVFSVSLWCVFARNSSTTKTQRTQRLHRENRFQGVQYVIKQN